MVRIGSSRGPALTGNAVIALALAALVALGGDGTTPPDPPTRVSG
ncbi:hypothetical protein [Nocardiopsis alkaliphila]|nr:hypothetical protein [Nocardiopsis alkaliphila]